MGDQQAFAELSKLNYKDQCIWFMNGFWNEIGPEKANIIYEWFEHFVKLDNLQTPPKGFDGNELDQFWSAKFLEDKDAAMPAIERKNALKEIDLDNNGKMSIMEYCTWKYKKGVRDVVHAPQGTDKQALAEAQAKIDAVMEAQAEVTRKLEAQKVALAESQAALAACVEAERPLKEAEEELRAAQEAQKAQEDAYEAKCNELERVSTQGSGVAKAKAANELAQLKSEDPLPLRKAKLTTEASLRKVTKLRAPFTAATEEAERKKLALEEAVRQLELAYDDLQQKLQEAYDELEAVKKKGGPANGAFYFMERELFEADCSLPRSKQRFDHQKCFMYIEKV